MVDFNKIIPNFPLPPERPQSQTDKADQKAKLSEKKASPNSQVKAGEEPELDGLVDKLPPDKVISKLGELLEKSVKDPRVEKMLLEMKVSPDSRQAVALCAFSCIKQILGKRLNLTNDDEKSVLESIKQEYEESVQKQGSLDPDERKKKQRERKKKSKPKVNALLHIIEEALHKLDLRPSGLSSEG